MAEYSRARFVQSHSTVSVRIAVFLNPRSGSAPTRTALAAALEKAGIAADIHVVPERNVTEAVSAVAAGYDVLAAAGGDGTVSAVAAVVLKSHNTLAVIPGWNHEPLCARRGDPAAISSRPSRSSPRGRRGCWTWAESRTGSSSTTRASARIHGWSGSATGRGSADCRRRSRQRSPCWIRGSSFVIPPSGCASTAGS